MLEDKMVNTTMYYKTKGNKCNTNFVDVWSVTGCRANLAYIETLLSLNQCL